MANAWRWSDLTPVGLGRGLVYGERPNHAALSMIGNGYIVTDKGGTALDVDLPAWCAKRGVPMPAADDLAWLRGEK